MLRRTLESRGSEVAMREKEIKDRFWKMFEEWMAGQTCGVYPNGELDYYECDVDAFFTKLKTGYDRQKDPMAWD